MGHSTRMGIIGVLAVVVVTVLLMLLRPMTNVDAASPLSVPPGATGERYDFEQTDLKGWRVVDGRWAVEDLAGARSGQRALVQRETKKSYDVIVAPAAPYGDVDATVRFKPISGREDASGGIVFRFRIYAYDRSRHQLASARVTPPALGQWHTIRVVAVGDRIQGFSTTCCSSTIVTGGFARGASACGPRPIR